MASSADPNVPRFLAIVRITSRQSSKEGCLSLSVAHRCSVSATAGAKAMYSAKDRRPSQHALRRQPPQVGEYEAVALLELPTKPILVKV